jgi:hypothetical protein
MGVMILVIMMTCRLAAKYIDKFFGGEKTLTWSVLVTIPRPEIRITGVSLRA